MLLHTANVFRITLQDNVVFQCVKHRLKFIQKTIMKMLHDSLLDLARRECYAEHGKGRENP